MLYLAPAEDPEEQEEQEQNPDDEGGYAMPVREPGEYKGFQRKL